jgi:hypothetical protein
LDFTFRLYCKLLKALIEQEYEFQTFTGFLEKPGIRTIILRHDVEAKYENALAFAKIQYDYHIRGSYYFRFLPDHFDDDIISEIVSMGHEIGYHYDDLSHCKGDYEAAIKRFEKNLATLRKIAEVKTICMEGAPLSKYDNRDLWRKSSVHRSPLTVHYKDYGIIGEPYFDLDFSKVFYLTDTGRRWGGGKVSVRDKVGSSQLAVRSSQQKIQPGNWELGTGNFSFHSTSDIITAANSGLLPDQIMMTFHPQRWTDKPLPWAKELVMQNIKNVAKRLILSAKH